jgi:hypothetical protein
VIHKHYSISHPSFSSQSGSPVTNSPARSARLVTWLRCHACHRGYFAAGAPSVRPCPACAGGRLQPVALWDLGHEAAPAGMLRRVSAAALRRLEVDL